MTTSPHQAGWTSAAATGSCLPGNPSLRNQLPKLNLWLVLLLLFGAVVVMADGLTREPHPDSGVEEPTPALEYEPFKAAYIFAIGSLPLCLLYGTRVGASKAEAFLLWFLLGTVTYTKDFAYIRVPGLPLFITDICLGLFIGYFWWHKRFRWLQLDQWWTRGILAFAASGLLCGLRGLAGRQEAMLILRDSAIVVYALFLYVGLYVIKSWESAVRVFLIIALGSVLATLNGLAWFLVSPEQHRFIAFGVYILAALLGVIILTYHRVLRPAVGWPLAAFLAMGALLVNARTVFVAFAIAMVIVALVGPSGRLRLTTKSLRLFARLALLSFLVIGVASQTRAGAGFLERVGTQLASGTLGYLDDPNAIFRFSAWLEALQRFGEHPVMGEGYGVPFTFEYADYDPRPHNTYLTVLYKMGVTGFIPLALFLAYFHWKGWGCVRRLHQPRESSLLYVVLIAHVAMCAYGCLNLLLESPFLASLFWLLSGVGIRMTYLARSSCQPVAL
jgi:O-antigen ligase